MLKERWQLKGTVPYSPWTRPYLVNHGPFHKGNLTSFFRVNLEPFPIYNLFLSSIYAPPSLDCFMKKVMKGQLVANRNW